MEDSHTGEWSAELAAELQRLSGLLRSDSTHVELAAGERRSVAVLFLDLKDYTGLAERLDHETLHHLVRSLMGLLAGEVKSSGGYVDKFEGDMIMALFGAGGESEAPCKRAVSCGLRMLERVTSAGDILARRGINLSARVGVSYGPVTVAPDPSGHLTATGDEVNVASRLQSHAPDCGLLASAAVRRAAGDFFSWRDTGEKRIRGRSEPVRTFQAEGPGPLRRSWWMEAAGLADTPFVDREREITELSRLLAEADGGVAAVVGDPGCGKTRLVREALSGLAGGRPVVTGRSMAFDQHPYWLWTEVLRDMAGSSQPEDHLRELFETAGDADAAYRLEMASDLLASVVSGDYDAGLDAGPEDADRLLAGLVGDAMRAASGTVLVLDDLHWLDSRSAAVLSLLLDSGPHRGSCVILAGRCLPDDLLASATLTLALEGLDAQALRKMAGHLLEGSGLFEEDIAELARRTADAVGSYPLYFRDMILYLVESGGLTAACDRRSGGELVLGRVPGTLSALVTSRFDQLDERHRRMLQFASVLGQEFPRKLLLDYLDAVSTETSATLPESPDGALELLFANKLLRGRDAPAGRTVSFRTPLARRVAYNTLLVHNRRILHGLAAAVCLRASGGPVRPGMAAGHLMAAGDVQRAVEQGLAELKMASDGCQTTEALRWAQTLLEWAEMPASGARAETVLRVMDMQRTALEMEGRVEECRRTLQRMSSMAETHGLPSWRARAMIGLGSLMALTGAPRDALELLRAGAGLAEEADDGRLVAAALGAQAQCSMRLGEPEEAEESLTSALRAAEEVGDGALAARCLLGKSQLELITGRAKSAVSSLRGLLRRAPGPGVRLRMAAMANLGAAQAELGAEDDAELSLLEAVRGARGIGDRRVEASCLCNMGALRRRRGETEKALADLRSALGLARGLEDGGLEAEALLNIGNALADGGDLEEAFEASIEALSVLKRLGGSRHMGLALRNAAVFAGRAESGRQTDRLYSELPDAMEMIGEEERPGVLIAASRAARRHGMMLRASELARAAEELPACHEDGQLAAVRAIQAICCLEGGDRTEAEALFAKALKLAENAFEDSDLKDDLEELRAALR